MDNYQSMKCKDCVLKHIANAMSYAKEILAGHGIGGTPDHRPDYLGELTNAEHHLEHISIELLNRVMVIRTAAQMRRMVPTDADIDELRELWIAVEATEVPEGAVMVAAPSEMLVQAAPKGQPVVPTETKKYYNYPGLEDMEEVGVLLADAWYNEENADKLKTFLKLYEANANNAVILDKESLDDYKGTYLWVFPIDCFISRKMDMKRPVLAKVSPGRKASFISRLVSTTKYIEALRTSVNTSDPAEVLDNTELQKSPDVPEEQAVVYVTRKPCCSIKARLSSQSLVRVNDDGWPYMKEFWGAN